MPLTTILDPNNRLFTLAQQGQRQASALTAIAVVPLMIAFMIVSQIVARLLLRPIFPGRVQSVADPIAEIIGFCPFTWACGSGFGSGANVLSGRWDLNTRACSSAFSAGRSLRD